MMMTSATPQIDLSTHFTCSLSSSPSSSPSPSPTPPTSSSARDSPNIWMTTCIKVPQMHCHHLWTRSFSCWACAANQLSWQVSLASQFKRKLCFTWKRPLQLTPDLYKGRILLIRSLPKTLFVIQHSKFLSCLLTKNFLGCCWLSLCNITRRRRSGKQ